MGSMTRMPRASTAQGEPLDPLAIFQEIEQRMVTQATQPNIYNYQPHPKQLKFHQLPEKERLFVAGNRSGKSYSCVVEGIYFLTKTHPYRENIVGQVRGRVVGVDFLNGIDKIIIPLYKQLMPAEYLINGSWADSYSEKHHVLTLKDGSFVEFMSQDQDLDKFAGTSRHFVHFDEECPKVIFEECKVRLIDTNGDWWMSETPVEGMEWIYDDLYEPYFDALEKGEKPRIGLVQMRTDENPYLNEEAIERILGSFSAEDRAVRQAGEYLQLSGSLYKDFREPTHADMSYEEFMETWNPAAGRMYLTGDHGVNNPTAWLWIWADVKGSLTVVREYYVSDGTVADHAKAIHEITAELGVKIYVTTGDPMMKQRTGFANNLGQPMSIADLYAEHGVHLSIDNIPRDKSVGVNKILMYLKLNPKTGRPFFTVLRECTNTIRELKGAKRNRWVNKKIAAMKNAPEGQREKDDHTTDAIRYAMTFMRDLGPAELDGTAPDRWDLVAQEYLATGMGVAGVYEPELAKRNKQAAEMMHGWRRGSGDTSADYSGME